MDNWIFLAILPVSTLVPDVMHRMRVAGMTYVYIYIYLYIYIYICVRSRQEWPRMPTRAASERQRT